MFVASPAEATINT